MDEEISIKKNELITLYQAKLKALDSEYSQLSSRLEDIQEEIEVTKDTIYSLEK